MLQKKTTMSIGGLVVKSIVATRDCKILNISMGPVFDSRSMHFIIFTRGIVWRDCRDIFCSASHCTQISS